MLTPTTSEETSRVVTREKALAIFADQVSILPSTFDFKSLTIDSSSFFGLSTEEQIALNRRLGSRFSLADLEKESSNG